MAGGTAAPDAPLMSFSSSSAPSSPAPATAPSPSPSPREASQEKSIKLAVHRFEYRDLMVHGCHGFQHDACPRA